MQLTLKGAIKTAIEKNLDLKAELQGVELS